MTQARQLDAARRPPKATPRVALPRSGVMLCVISGIAFGSAAVFAKESFASGWSVSTLLATRFVLAAAIFWTVVAIRRPARPSARSAVICIVLGAVGYALQSGFYFAALTKMNAAVVA